MIRSFPMTIPAGTRLGRYVGQSALGAGGMGEVYRATDTRLARDVAIKVLPAHMAVDPARLERFEREAQSIAALSHANILAIFDVGTGDVPYLVTELLDGERFGPGSRAAGCRPPRRWPLRGSSSPAWRRPMPAASCTAT
jgi:hypothetical protein